MKFRSKTSSSLANTFEIPSNFNQFYYIVKQCGNEVPLQIFFSQSIAQKAITSKLLKGNLFPNATDFWSINPSQIPLPRVLFVYSPLENRLFSFHPVVIGTGICFNIAFQPDARRKGRTN